MCRILRALQSLSQQEVLQWVASELKWQITDPDQLITPSIFKTPSFYVWFGPHPFLTQDMTWSLELIPPPETRQPLTTPTFIRHIVSPFICYYASAILILTPNTRAIRLAVLPLSLWTLFNSATRVDLAKTFGNEKLAFLNMGFVLAYTSMGMRLIVWSTRKDPYWRVKGSSEVTPEFYSRKPPTSVTRDVFIDATELTMNSRGRGWNWSQSFRFPKEIRPTSSIAAFAITTLVSMLLHTTMLDFIQYSILSIQPSLIDAVEGGSIFDHSLPPHLRYSKSTLITTLMGFAAYSMIQLFYDMGTLIGVVLFRQDISLWPPLFNAPWLSASVDEFWARRWHQIFREPFIIIGGKPFAFLFGRAAGVLGVFTLSGFIHVFGQWALGRGTDILPVAGFFFMNGVGIILENGYRNITGCRVGGWVGRIWSMLWLIGWSHLFAEAFSTKGLLVSVFLPEKYRPSTHILGPLS